jgi:hypothetical protein
MTLSARHAIAYACVLILGLGANPVSAQEATPATMMDPNDAAVVQVISGLGELTERAGQRGFGLDSGFSFVIGFLKQGEQKGLVSPLEAGKNYMFIGKGDEDVLDLDIHIVDEDGKVVASDTLTDNFPILSFKPTKKGRYSVRLKLESAKIPGFCGLVVLKEGAPRFTRADLLAASTRMLGVAGRVRKSLDNKINYETDSNEWSILGTILQKGESTTMGPYTGAGMNYVIYGVGDDDVEDLDLEILDAANGKVLAGDTKNDNIPVCEFDTGKEQNFTVKLINAGGKAALCFAAVMRKREITQ